MEINIVNNIIHFMREGEIGTISAIKEGCIRFKATASMKLSDENWTLLPDTDCNARAWQEGNVTFLQTGNLKLRMEDNGSVSYWSGDKLLIREQPEQTFGFGYRNYRSVGSGLWKIRVTFEANEQEQFYGLGHERMNVFSKKGCTVDLMHLNTKCSIPYVYSSLGYGFLWNMPSTGTAELANNRTRWSSDSAKGVDYVVIEGSPKEVCGKLTDLTGHAPLMPEWALGFWQCKLRYENQEQILEVARKYKELGVPISVIIIDYFHWTEQGDYKFDPKFWPNPKEMAEKLHEMGIKLMVSMWPTINEHSENYYYMLNHNMLLRTASGSNRVFDFYGPQAEIDPSNPQAREYIWNRLKENYIDNGVDQMWFDEAEPEIHPEHFDNILMYAGRGDEVGLMYPYFYSQLVYDGMKKIGRKDVVTLSRCAYLGAQKFGTVVWSGDIRSSFESLTEQIKSGLNMAMCGIPWWNTDIGGFYGGNIESDYFRELIVRWFQYGVFCPVMRLHGSRDGHDRSRDIKEPTGGDNEIWSFGDKNLPILSELIALRYRLIPYIKEQMDVASNEGIPVMRPMFVNYPMDEVCYQTGDQYFFGEDILFAPISVQGQTQRRVYLPEGNWILTKDKTRYEGNTWITVSAQIEEFIAFVREGAKVLEVF
ncbi:MAG: glycoside hydrolase family 31 protein [Lachnospiraceae bacterium]|nr:glycoside hydrolase family 31 protein [Lachnospiraceae bacterium]